MLLEPDYRIHLRAGTHDGAEDSHAHGLEPEVYVSHPASPPTSADRRLTAHAWPDALIC